MVVYVQFQKSEEGRSGEKGRYKFLRDPRSSRLHLKGKGRVLSAFLEEYKAMVPMRYRLIVSATAKSRAADRFTKFLGK